MSPAPALPSALAALFHPLAIESTYAYFSSARGLCGSIITGRPDGGQMQRLVRLWESEISLEPHDSLFDARALVAVDPQAFVHMSQYLHRHQAALRQFIRRQAIVRPDGIAGTIVAGFTEVYHVDYPVEIFDDRERALDWLGHAALSKPLQLLEQTLGAGGMTVSTIHEQITAALPQATLVGIARALGVSARSLQRALQLAGTSFRAELRAVQLTRAKELLAATDDKLASIAADVGYTRPQQLHRLFISTVGQAPSAWRSTHRRGKGSVS